MSPGRFANHVLTTTPRADENYSFPPGTVFIKICSPQQRGKKTMKYPNN